MNTKLILTGLFMSASFIAVSAATAPDYTKIRKDLNVMSQVVKGAFEDSATCQGCKVKISTNYLAEQGAVFTINTYKNQNRFSFSNSDDVNNQTFVIREPPLNPIAPLSSEDFADLESLPELMSNIFVEVGDSLEDAAARIEIVTGDERNIEAHQAQAHRSSRGALRDAKREIRDLEYRIRDLEIEMLHSSEEKEQKVLASRIEELEKEVATSQDRKNLLNVKYEAVKSTYRKARSAQKEAAAKKNKILLAAVQDIVIQTFCDYGATLRHLPNNERVSIIFTQRKSNKDTIYVIKKGYLANCSSGEQLKTRALTYMF